MLVQLETHRTILAVIGTTSTEPNVNLGHILLVVPEVREVRPEELVVPEEPEV
jgi:hypothetical protein